MQQTFRISTSPPTFGEPKVDDASYYCDILQMSDWKAFAVARRIRSKVLAILEWQTLESYRVMMAGDKEVALLLCYRDAEGELMYCAVDHAARTSCEPAANEALWSAANAAVGLPNGYRLARHRERAGLRLVPPS